MKPRTLLYILAGLLTMIVGLLWLYFTTVSREGSIVFPATINRDCAPWDGSAFTISIPYELGSIQISIWKSPEINLPIRFLFPDESSNLGNAIYQPLFGSYKPLKGEVFFWHVHSDSPVEGEFNFALETGKQVKGNFKAVWGSQAAICG